MFAKRTTPTVITVATGLLLLWTGGAEGQVTIDADKTVVVAQSAAWVPQTGNAVELFFTLDGLPFKPGPQPPGDRIPARTSPTISQPVLTVHFTIALFGIFPSRGGERDAGSRMECKQPAADGAQLPDGKAVLRVKCAETSGAKPGEVFKTSGQSAQVLVPFETNRSDITDEIGRRLRAGADAARRAGDADIVVEGCAGSSEQGSLALAMRRAIAIREFLVEAGVDAGRMAVISCGGDSPMAGGATSSPWAVNRRGHFTILSR